MQRRFHSITKTNFKMAKILESYYQNGLNNYSSHENKEIITNIVQDYKNVFQDEEQVKVSFLATIKPYKALSFILTDNLNLIFYVFQFKLQRAIISTHLRKFRNAAEARSSHIVIDYFIVAIK